jgi:hypothetical protein
MTTMDVATVVGADERSAAAPRPVARWSQQREADGSTRLRMTWSVPDASAELARLLDAR